MRATNFATRPQAIQPLLLALLLVSLLAACGRQAAQPSENKPTAPGTPVPGNIQKQVTFASGHNESLVIAGGVTFAGSDTGSVYALRASDGGVLWQRALGDMTEVYSVTGGMLIVIVYTGQQPSATLDALATDSGMVLWQRSVDAAGGVMGLAVDANAVYVETDAHGSVGGAISAFRASDGTPLWSFTAPLDLTGPLMLADGLLYTKASDQHSGAPSLYALRPSDGHVLWTYAPPQEYSDPVIVNGVVYLVTELASNGMATAVQVDALVGATGKLLWQYTNKGDSMEGNLIVADGIVYIPASSNVYALRTGDGTLLWRVPKPDHLMTTPVAGDGAVYLALGLGSIYALRASDGATLWQQHIDNSLLYLLEENGRLEVATQSHFMYALAASDGTLLWKQTIDNFNSASTAGPDFSVHDGVVYVATDRGVVQAVRASDGVALWRYAITPKPVLTDPVYSAAVTFDTTVTYAQALRAVTDLGLRPIMPCVDPDGAWQPVNVGSWFPGSLLVLSTPIAPLGWLDPLGKIPGVQRVQPNPIYNCPSMSAETPGAAGGFLAANDAGTYVRATFASGMSYDDALALVTRLGFRLGNPCYEQQPQGAQSAWQPMGQESGYAAAHALMLATTRSNATAWQGQLQSASGVTGVAVAPQVDCSAAG